ncbi:2'-5' RNA ligase family protein [Variovorax boronicumulans]|uniref:2'-5' RNA ligase family protein n=1 Tax=Variovorax boronicumulans TaxID=436515 RepID=UPI0033944F2B
MPEQLLLPGIDPPPRPLPRPRTKARRKERLPHTLFLAIFPSAQDAASIAALGAQFDGQHSLKATPVAAPRLHVTLHDLGGYETVPRKKVQAAFEAAATLTPPSFDVVFEQAMTYANAKAFVLCGEEGVAALAEFRQRLGEALADAGFKPERSFTPHMTLAYTQRKVEKHAIEPVRWTAGSFALIDSHVGEGVHEVLGRWPA